MSENAPYAKMWFTSLTDSRTGSLDNSSYGLWVKLVLLTKKEGHNGSVTFPLPLPNIIKALLHIENDAALLQLADTLNPSLTVTQEERSIIVTFAKWKQHQVDNSTPRVQKHRAMKQNDETKVKRSMKRIRDIESLSLSLSNSNNPNPRNKNNIIITPEFVKFWGFYPRHVAKESAIKAWNKIDPGLHETIYAKLQTIKWPDDSTKIPHAATWLNGKRWEDEPDTEPVTNKTVTNGCFWHARPNCQDPKCTS